jgi:NRPS condensation-like uncharacterized protein
MSYFIILSLFPLFMKAELQSQIKKLTQKHIQVSQACTEIMKMQ